MNFYLVSYDLLKPDHDYKPLYAELGNLNATRVQESVWVLCSDRSASDILKSLWMHLHSKKDRLLVAQMNGNWASKRAIEKIKPLAAACRE
jgi:CRISPR/Cas system-associated endoribonuclease Cas2